MVLSAEDLTIQAINPAYTQLLADRDITGLPVDEVFAGKDTPELLKVLKTSIRKGDSINTAPIMASVNGNNEERRFVHTIVPISNETGAGVSRLFVYSERVE
jgi:hypothetical protein